MAEHDKTYHIFLSAAEPSADAHCAGLINALKQTGHNFSFTGVGGAKMAEAGCQLLEETAGRAAMIYKAFAHVARFFKLIIRIKAFFKKEKLDLVVVCDSPAFNFHIAKAAKKAGVKTLFYVAPQLWAWAPWRIKKLKKCCDKLCCILPFEPEWFSQRGLEATFVGNPLTEELANDPARAAKNYTDLKNTDLTIALMPGSRPAEIKSLWQPMQQIAVRIKKQHPSARFTAVAADAGKKQMLRSSHILGFRCNYDIGSVSQAASNADFTIVASGSATLQVAAAGCPMVIMYQSSPILWHLIGRWLVKSKYLSLVNILAQCELVPEFMPYFTSINPIAETIEKLLADPEKLAQISTELIELTKPLAQTKASRQVSEIIIEMLENAKNSAN